MIVTIPEAARPLCPVTFVISSAAVTVVTLTDSNTTVSGFSSQTYTGSAITFTSLTVKYGNTTLVAGTDNEVTYSDNVNVGTATITITGTGNYTGTITKEFSISGRTIANASVTGITNAKYTGKYCCNC